MKISFVSKTADNQKPNRRQINSLHLKKEQKIIGIIQRDPKKDVKTEILKNSDGYKSDASMNVST